MPPKTPMPPKAAKKPVKKPAAPSPTQKSMDNASRIEGEEDMAFRAKKAGKTPPPPKKYKCGGRVKKG